MSDHRDPYAPPRTPEGYPYLMAANLRPLYDHYKHAKGMSAGYASNKHNALKITLRAVGGAAWEQAYGKRSTAELNEIKTHIRRQMEALEWIFDEKWRHEHAKRNGFICPDGTMTSPMPGKARMAAGRVFRDDSDKAKWKTTKNALMLLGAWDQDDRPTVRKAWKNALINSHPDRGGSVKKAQSVNWAWMWICSQKDWAMK